MKKNWMLFLFFAAFAAKNKNNIQFLFIITMLYITEENTSELH